MNIEDLDVALSVAFGAARFGKRANHITVWVKDDEAGNPVRARVTVHVPYSEGRDITAAYDLLEAMGGEPFTFTVKDLTVQATARHDSAEVELVVALGSAQEALAAIPAQRDADDDRHHDLDDEVRDARLDVLLDGADT